MQVKIWMVRLMNSAKQHKKVQISGKGDCSVIFCPDCNTLEVSLGAFTLRLNPEAFHTLARVVNMAKEQLARIQEASLAEGNTRSVSMRNDH
jgi:hypothetical protein